MNKRKIMMLALSVCMIAILAVGGTLAYFTDTDSAVNSFTVGGVKIALHEDNKDGKKDDKYQEWLEDQVLMPGDNETNTVAKVVTVENTGKSDAYVRLHIAIPAVLDRAQPDFDASKNLLHFNAYDDTHKSGKWNWGTKVTESRNNFVGSGDAWNEYDTTINGIDYHVYVVTYETALTPGATTVSAMHQVYLYKDVTNADIEKADKILHGNWNIYVAAEGCQTDGFNNAFEALNTSFGQPNGSVDWSTIAKAK